MHVLHLARVRLALFRLAPSKLAPVRMAPRRLQPRILALQRMAPLAGTFQAELKQLRTPSRALPLHRPSLVPRSQPSPHRSRHRTWLVRSAPFICGPVDAGQLGTLQRDATEVGTGEVGEVKVRRPRQALRSLAFRMLAPCKSTWGAPPVEILPPVDGAEERAFEAASDDSLLVIDSLSHVGTVHVGAAQDGARQVRIAQIRAF